MTLSPHMPDLAGLALLLEVARAGSIGGAARALEITQQSASERLRTVEAQVGVTLVRRGARGSTLTPAGTVLVEWAARLLDLADEVDGAIGSLRAERSRELHLAASMTVAEHLVPRWLVQLRQRQEAERRPPTSVSLLATNSRHVVEMVQDGSADLGFVEGTGAPAGLRSRDVGHDDLVLVVSPSDPLAAHRVSLTPQQVAAMSLTSREVGSGTRDVLQTALAEHGLTMNDAAVELTTSSAVRASVRAGGAPAVVSRLVVGADLESGQLVEVPTPGLRMRRTFRAVWSGPAAPPAGPIRELLGLIGRSRG
ncbi:LysR substrate-binding domain-containing protein [Aeromicrobium stalagmiti]|uniref:LysR substrate-binding domain-containing protein n=1 Tax=Aeromicrobium stalagmiti TaxID=2738988 RepID=UPI0034645F50